MLPDDPAFLPDLPLLGLEAHLSQFDLSALSAPLAEDSQTLEAVGHLRQENVARAPIGLAIPTSDTHGGSEAGDLGIPGYGLGTVHGIMEDYPSRIQEDEGEGFLPDIGFEFDGEGNLHDVSLNENNGATAGITRARHDSESAASGRVRREHDEGLRARLDVRSDFLGNQASS